MDSSSSCGPQANAHPPPPIAHAPTPIGVNSRSLLPSRFFCISTYNNGVGQSRKSPPDAGSGRGVFLPLAPQDFRKRSDENAMDVMSTALGGMRDAQTNLEKMAERVAGASASTPDSVDLSTEMVGMLAARDQFQLNARVFQTAGEMQKKLLDILA